MRYRFRKREWLIDGVRRIAREQLDAALAAMRDPAVDRDRAVFEVRRRCKRVRALLRLARPSRRRAWKRDNAALRDAGRTLASERDRYVAARTLDRLLARYDTVLDRRAFGGVVAAVAPPAERVDPTAGDRCERWREVGAILDRTLDRIAKWKLRNREFEALRPGLVRTYASGREALAEVRRGPTTERLHEWRRRVKDHRFHVALLVAMWKPVMAARLEGLEELSDLLGEDHDLFVLRQALDEAAIGSEPRPDVEVVLALIDRRRSELQARAIPLGEWLFARKPKVLGRRLARRWRRWHRPSRSRGGDGTVVRFDRPTRRRASGP